MRCHSFVIAKQKRVGERRDPFLKFGNRRLCFYRNTQHISTVVRFRVFHNEIQRYQHDTLYSTASNDWMTDEQIIGMDMEGSGHVLI
jgi:hypothetical protein